MSPLQKKTDKNSILNYRPVSILPTFSKIFVKAYKKYLTESMDNYFLLHLSAYRASEWQYTTCAFAFNRRMKNKVLYYFIVGTILMDLSKDFPYTPYDLLRKLCFIFVHTWKIGNNV